MLRVREVVEEEAGAGFCVPEYLMDIIDVLCEQEDVNRVEFSRRDWRSYEQMRSVIA